MAILLPMITTTSIWNSLPPPQRDNGPKSLKKEINRFRNNLTNMLTQLDSNIRLKACRPRIGIDPILWLPMTTRERIRVVRWRIGFLPGKPIRCWCARDNFLTTITHLNACFHLHLELGVLNNFEINPWRIYLKFPSEVPISYVLNKLPKNPSKYPHQQEYWCRIWPKLCAISYDIDYCCHLDEDFTSSKDPDPGRLLLKWIQSANENSFDCILQSHQNLNNINIELQSLHEASWFSSLYINQILHCSSLFI